MKDVSSQTVNTAKAFAKLPDQAFGPPTLQSHTGNKKTHVQLPSVPRWTAQRPTYVYLCFDSYCEQTLLLSLSISRMSKCCNLPAGIGFGCRFNMQSIRPNDFTNGFSTSSFQIGLCMCHNFVSVSLISAFPYSGLASRDNPSPAIIFFMVFGIWPSTYQMLHSPR